ncbi:MAG: methyltransferase domain-containing protein [Pseudomonadota bacterium]
MDELELLIDLHKDGERQGPGGERETRRAIELADLHKQGTLEIADIGCGTGASTLVLAEALDAHITAVDLFDTFLSRLALSADERNVGERITCLQASMETLPFDDQSLDVIWSEGAIYNVGFEAGITAWRRFLKPGGVLAVSELTWLTEHRPEALEAHWGREYPEVDTASAKLGVLEQLGFTILGYFPLPESCWIDNYYQPVRDRLPAFLETHADSDAARQLADAEAQEIELYERFRQYVSYGFYIARKIGAT